ncbi:MAG: S-layer family protein [Richelia sp.]|nr:S-layer family protein [Richelia sp.]
MIIKDGAIINVSNFAASGNSPAGKGKTGNLQINAQSILLDSAVPNSFSRITASSAVKDGGDIFLNVTDSFIARNGSKILAETRGDGKGGTLNINSNSVQFTTGAAISTSTIIDKGDGGKINIQTNELSLDGLSTGLFSKATANSLGNSRDINIHGKRVSLTNGAQISTISSGLGQAGNINILFERLETNDGKITATSEKTGGGNISLIATSSEIFLRNRSLVSTSVFDSTGSGGNIFISADTNALLENSEIKANAVFGPAGNIQINTKGLFLSPDSKITASSEFGIDGEVEVNNTEENKKINNQELPATPLYANKLVARSCSQTENYFVVAGRGGLPTNPSQGLRSQNLCMDLRSQNGKLAQSQPKQINDSVNQTSENTQKQVQSNPSQLLEAQGLIVNADGKL